MWSLAVMAHDSQGIPSLRLLTHGSVDPEAPDPVGIDAVVQHLLLAVDRTA